MNPTHYLLLLFQLKSFSTPLVYINLTAPSKGFSFILYIRENIFLVLKKSSCIALLIIILLQSGGMLLLFQIRQFNIQYRMEVLISRKETKFLKMVMSVSEYQKCRIDAGEILVNGEMYDVKSLVHSAGKIELLVIHDKHEGGLIKRIQQLAAGSKENNSPLPNYLIKWLSVLYFSPFLNINFMQDQLLRTKFISNSIDFFSFVSEVISPPPEGY